MSDEPRFMILDGPGCWDPPWRLRVFRRSASPLAIAKIVAPRLGLTLTAARNRVTADEFIDLVLDDTDLAHELYGLLDAAGASLELTQLRPPADEPA